MTKPDPYFFDTEFNEQVKTRFGVDFISIGLVNMDGESYYGVNNKFNAAAARRNAWVHENVIAKLPPKAERKFVDDIRRDVIDFIKPAEAIELFAHNNSYDVFVFCRLFGGMRAMRETLHKEKGIKKVIFTDMKDVIRGINPAVLPSLPEDMKHDSVVDARLEREVYLAAQREKMRPRQG